MKGFPVRYGRSIRLSFLISLVLGVSSGLTAQEVSRGSVPYRIGSSTVVEGRYSARAVSPTEIVSGYQSDYKIRTPREIQIKFGFNGMDNEAPAGQNHYVLLSPVDGKFTTPVFSFGKFAPQISSSGSNSDSTYLSQDVRVTIRVDMRGVIGEIAKRGYYQTLTGQKIFRKNLSGLSVAGDAFPLSWNFGDLPNEPQFAMSDPDSDGIYEVTILIKKDQYPGRSDGPTATWHLSKDISAYSQYTSGSLLSEALYNMSLEEMVEDIRPDGAFMAGKMWPGVWTRDISYSSLLSLAIINPDAVKASLLAKVKNDRIIQDTGTGGSWPVSSDRMVWTLAAWEVYKVTGDREWLSTAYRIAANSAQADVRALPDRTTGLFRGESSFLDWREQTYPRWMDPKDIFQSENLGTNAVHYETYRILGAMANALDKSSADYEKIAGEIKTGINEHLWMNDKGYYGQYLYGRNFKALSPRSESLGEALCVLFGIADGSRGQRVIANAPETEFGMTCIYPEIPNIPPYHNDAVWPFVESYWAWASARVHNGAAVSRAIASVYRAAALFLTNKENMVASTGDFMGTQINSSRQLWSVAGDLAIVYRVLFGMNFQPDSLILTPFVPKEYGGVKKLSNFKYRNASLDMYVDGFGDGISNMTIDGRQVAGSAVPASLSGHHTVRVIMNGRISSDSRINMARDVFAPETPEVVLDGRELKWKDIDGAAAYRVFKNGKQVAELTGEKHEIPEVVGYSEYQVAAVDKAGSESFLSEPVVVDPARATIDVQAEMNSGTTENKFAGYTGKGYVVLEKADTSRLVYSVDICVSGTYSIDFRYANGSGPINTDNKCAVRSVMIDGSTAGVVVMPQRGEENWQDWGYSSAIHATLSKGRHDISIRFDKYDDNMNGSINKALLDAVRVTLISGSK